MIGTDVRAWRFREFFKSALWLLSGEKEETLAKTCLGVNATPIAPEGVQAG